MHRRVLYSRAGTPLWRDVRVLRIIGQIIFLILLGVIAAFLVNNMLTNLRQQGLSLSFGFLRSTSGFDIGEHLIPYDRSSTFLQALSVGLLNTLLVAVLGIILATALGVLFGVARLSHNFLVNQLARIYIEFLRNIPLLVLLVFLFTGVFIQLPRIREAYMLPGPILLTNRGIAFPWPVATETFPQYGLVLFLGVLLGAGTAIGLSWRARRSERTPRGWLWGLLVFLLVALVGWFLMPSPAFRLETPAVEGLRIAGGRILSPNLLALLWGLAIYTSAFIADVVRAGIQSVSRGQLEAASSLGLTSLQTLRLVILPQAMRVIIPPLTSQYLNLIKNSSLAVLIGFPELFHVAGTILNQSGRAVEVISLVMLVYLCISLGVSLVMNWYNRRVRLVER
jgi:general L-amino acid transport system permease protein